METIEEYLVLYMLRFFSKRDDATKPDKEHLRQSKHIAFFVAVCTAVTGPIPGPIKVQVQK